MATGRLIGTDTNGTGTCGANFVAYAKFTALATGVVTEIHVYALANGYVKVGLYTDDDGSPSSPANKVAGNNDGQAVVANQWNTLSIPLAKVVKDTKYWLGMNCDTTGAVSWLYDSGGRCLYKAATYSSFTWPDSAGSGWIGGDGSSYTLAGYGILVLSPSSIDQPLSYGSPKLNLSIKPSGIIQLVACGMPKVDISGIMISPQGISVIISYGTPTLRYPQTISPQSIIITITYGTPSVGTYGVIVPQSISQPVAIGSPIILKYVWHVILDGQYAIETPGVNRTYIIGRDQYGNPVYGTAVNADEIALVGERLDFQQELAIPTDSQAASMASAILSKMRISKDKGVILVPPNCGQELFDVVQISDSGANQSAVKFRVTGIRFEYNPKQAHYEHKLILGTP